MDPIRKAFEEVCAPNFSVGYLDLSKNKKGEYLNGVLEDHWQTFQEGWECALNHLKNKNNPCYTDIISDGRMDPRNEQSLV